MSSTKTLARSHPRDCVLEITNSVKCELIRERTARKVSSIVSREAVKLILLNF